MVKYFRAGLTTALLAALSMPAFAQMAPAAAPTSQPGDMAPATPDAAKPADAAKPVHRHHHRHHHHHKATTQQPTDQTAPAAAPSN